MLRYERPEGPFDLVLCRNLAFTYFDNALQLKVLGRIIDTMHDGAALVIGIHENLPAGAEKLSMWIDKQRIYQKSSGKVEDLLLRYVRILNKSVEHLTSDGIGIFR